MKISCIKLMLLVFILFVFISSFSLSHTAYSAETTVEKSGSDVLVRIGDEVITKADLETALMRLPENRRGKNRDSTLNQLIEVTVFSNEARKTDLDKDPKIKEALKRAENEILARHFIKKYIDEKSEPSDEEMKKYYSEHKAQFA